VLVVMLVARDETLMPYYAAMATLGSVCGCLVLYVIGRRGGEALLRRRFGGVRVTRAMGSFKRFGVLAVVIPAILPPPAPFKVFVLLSGVAKVPTATFCAAVTLGRGIRYFGEGALAVRYGDQAIDFLQADGPWPWVGIAAVCAVAVIAYALLRGRGRGHA
jgi:membrane protein YqaA with SNARE-associated domain